jgi:hypothetical protein
MGDNWNDDRSGIETDLNVVEIQEVKLFGKWSCDEINVSDMSLQVNLIKTNL